MAVARGGGAGGWWGRGPDGRVVGQEADSRESDGAGAVGQGGPDGWEGDGRVHEGQMGVAGDSGGGIKQEFKMVGRQGPDRSSNGQMGEGYCRQDGGMGHWGRIPDRGWDGVLDT